MKKVTIFYFLLLCSCDVKNKPDFKIVKLFTHEGCTVYRFEDSGSLKYFTNCSGSTSWNNQIGKMKISEEINGGKHYNKK